jgi:IclR family transcriptional regulator, KDG regulon repressor
MSAVKTAVSKQIAYALQAIDGVLNFYKRKNVSLSGNQRTLSENLSMLAWLPEEKVNLLLGQDLHRYTPNTITDLDDLKRQLHNIRREGMAVDDEEGYLGVRGIACPFKNEENSVAGSVTILGPTVRLTRQKVAEYAPMVKDCASGISRALGCKGP